MTEEAKKLNAVTAQESGTPEAQPQADTSPEPKEPQEGSKEFNFRALEKKNAETEQRVREQEAMNRELVALLKQGKEPAQPTEEVLPQLNPDDIPEWKHVDQFVNLRAQKIAEKTVQDILAKQEKERLPKLAKERYKDFDQIVTAERIKQLEQENPALAQGLSLSRDPYTATYSYLKAIYGQKKQDPVAMEEAEKILENASKPISSNAIGQQSALKNANNFQKKSKDQLYKEMMACANNM